LQLYQNNLRNFLCHWQCYWMKDFMYLVQVFLPVQDLSQSWSAIASLGN